MRKLTHEEQTDIIADLRFQLAEEKKAVEILRKLRVLDNMAITEIHKQSEAMLSCAK